MDLVQKELFCTHCFLAKWLVKSGGSETVRIIWGDIAWHAIFLDDLNRNFTLLA